MNDFLHPVYLWYAKNQRELPWRETTDPYKIWVSEIILQQTRVAQGLPYYLRFIETFPTISSLAAASEDDVLKIWQGLGYYSRALNMHATARLIQKNYGTEFPENYEDIRKLKGIGAYTAASVASIAFGLPYPAVDGNVYRVLARYYGILEPADTSKGRKVFENIATELIREQKPGFHNQAMMEFGALMCVPKSPNCQACPVNATCFAFRENQVENLPVKKSRVKPRKRYFLYYFLESGKNTWLEKRTKNDIWKNLYQFPVIETEGQLSDSELASIRPGFLNGHNYNFKTVSSYKKHVLTHQIIYARLVHLEIDEGARLNENFEKVAVKDIENFAVPRLVEILLEHTGYF